MFLKARAHHPAFGVPAQPADATRDTTGADEIWINIPSIDVPVARLSGGQRTAIAVARTISGNADIILLDEPLAAMGAKEGGDDPRSDCALKAEGNLGHHDPAQLRPRPASLRPGQPHPGRVISLDKPTSETSVEELTGIVVEEYRRARLEAQADGSIASAA